MPGKALCASNILWFEFQLSGDELPRWLPALTDSSPQKRIAAPEALALFMAAKQSTQFAPLGGLLLLPEARTRAAPHVGGHLGAAERGQGLRGCGERGSE